MQKSCVRWRENLLAPIVFVINGLFNRSESSANWLWCNCFDHSKEGGILCLSFRLQRGRLGNETKHLAEIDLDACVDKSIVHGFVTIS